MSVVIWKVPVGKPVGPGHLTPVTPSGSRNVAKNKLFIIGLRNLFLLRLRRDFVLVVEIVWTGKFLLVVIVVICVFLFRLFLL